MKSEGKYDYLNEETIRRACKGSFDSGWLLKSHYEGYARKCLDSMIRKYDLDICSDDEEEIIWKMWPRLTRVLNKKFIL